MTDEIKERFAKYEYGLNGKDIEWLIQQNVRYKQALEYIQREIRKAIYTPKNNKWNSDFEREFEKGKTIGLIQTSDIVNEAIEALEGERRFL